MEWQPIETAPKDSSEVLCWAESFPFPCFLVWKTNPRIVHAHNKGEAGDLSASYFGDPDEMDDYTFAERSGQPTHWLLLPPLPTS